MNVLGFAMPARRLDYLLMGVVAGVIAGLVCVYILGITYFELLKASQAIGAGFKMAWKH